MTATSHIHVRPVYLAGPGDRADITTPMLRHGWAQEDGLPHPSLRAPGDRASLRQNPEGDWSLACHSPVDGSPAWSVSFTAQTPSEAVAASAVATAQFLSGADHRHLRELGSPDAVAARAGWLSVNWSGRPATWRSPDRAARLVYTPSHLTQGARWSVSVNAGQQGEAGWRADFTSGAPAWVINAALEAASADRPVTRHVDGLPRATLLQLTTPTAARQPEDRRSAAGLRYIRPVRLNQAAATTTGPAPDTTGPSRSRR
ncbi:DUF317 domain-containing protein [Kitasatospora sp. NPDC101235]|uniref:DUF317 domain-containing protein n=1 Tax=Kitasatospora sp. NPDC101235 TaxID=3364101 RepID=UPI0038079FA9